MDLNCVYCREKAEYVKDGNSVCVRHKNLYYPWESPEKVCRWCGEPYITPNDHAEVHDYGGK